MSQSTPVLVAGARTAIGRLGGGLARYTATELGSTAVRAALSGLDGVQPDFVAMGNVVQAGNGQNPARIAAVHGGVDRRVPGVTLNDVCLASMSAVTMVARMIKAGELTRGLVGGFESMSRAPWAVQRLRRRSETEQSDSREPFDLLVNDGLWCTLDGVGMGSLSDAENVRFGIGRPEQDDFSVESHRRAARARASGRLAEEIDGAGLNALTADEGPRPGISPAKLAGLVPAFTANGTITAGNASQMSDAAAAGMVMAHGEAVSAGFKPIVAVEGSAVVAGPDSSLHLMPALAAAKLLERHGLTSQEIGLWEINEAFAAVVIASMRELGVDHERVNVNGGAVALGHPLGASGFRLLLTLAHEMRHRDVEWGVAAICGGGGQGQAILLRSI